MIVLISPRSCGAAFHEAPLSKARWNSNISSRRSSLSSIRRRRASTCRSICAVLRSSSVYGRPCATSRSARRPAMPKLPRVSACRSPPGPWPRPVRQTPQPWQCLAIAWSAAAVRFPVIAGVLNANGRCSKARLPHGNWGRETSIAIPRYSKPMIDLFGDPTEQEEPAAVGLAPILLRGLALKRENQIFAEIERVAQAAPFRRMVTPGGYTMSAAMTNCGAVGWVTDRNGYRYDRTDPVSGEPWPPMPGVFGDLATAAATVAGFAGFVADACLINCYEPGAKLSLHQDKDETDFTAPIVSVSLGLPATFLFGGLKRSDAQVKIPLVHGDVVVWGGKARLAYHGVMPLRDGIHPALGRRRINLTFRKAL